MLFGDTLLLGLLVRHRGQLAFARGMAGDRKGVAAQSFWLHHRYLRVSYNI
jgi:hypothetical protein